jgi:hypothetical protein
MSQFDKDLKSYAANGMRSAADWATLGREVQDAARPCTHTAYRGEPVALFTRRQTRQALRRQNLKTSK